jgi:L-ascorbate 6-phosphate lactonase
MAYFPWDIEIPNGKAALWFLGQAGYYMRSGGRSVIIDPYLSDCVGKVNPPFARVYPPPVNPAEIKADIFIATHDHLDHLDPETVGGYSFKETTAFVAPRFAANKLADLGVPRKNINVVDCGDTLEIKGICIKGVFALPTGADVLDTAGYLLTFENGKSIYHTSDTAYCDLLIESCPRADVLLPCINGKTFRKRLSLRKP